MESSYVMENSCMMERLGSIAPPWRARTERQARSRQRTDTYILDGELVLKRELVLSDEPILNGDFVLDQYSKRGLTGFLKAKVSPEST